MTILGCMWTSFGRYFSSYGHIKLLGF